MPLSLLCSAAALAGATFALQDGSPNRFAKQLAELDAAFTSNDLGNVHTCLAQGDSPACALLEIAAKSTFDVSTVLSRRTEPLRTVTIGKTDAVYARVTTLVRPKSGAKGAVPFDRRVVDHAVFFFAPSPAGPALARMEFCNVNTLTWLDQPKITCPPCFWTVKRPAGWFLVPKVAREGGAFDAFSLIHPALDLSIDFDSLTASNAAPPLELAERDQRALAEKMQIPSNGTTTVSRRTSVENELARADLVVDLAASPTARALRFHRCYRRLGPFVYTFVVHGDASAAERATAETNAILDGLELLPPALEVEKHLERIAAAHAQGGGVDKSRYANSTLGVVIDGPDGWPATQLPGQGRFRVQYQCPSDADTRISFFTREGDAPVYGQSTIEAFFRDREANLPKDEYRDHRVLRRETGMHPNKIDAMFEVEAEWTSAAGAPMREWLVAIPSGRILFCICARGPKTSFEAQRDAVERSIASFAHTLAK